ncbi:MAG: 3-phosphoshikimate 1-carboxyvinyltransferase [Planctomycetota bacterium]
MGIQRGGCNPLDLDAASRVAVYDPGMNDSETSNPGYWSPPQRDGQPIEVIGHADLVGSKSVSQRVILLAALAKGGSEIIGAPLNEDLQVFIDALVSLGLEISGELPGPLHVEGCGGQLPAGDRRVDLGANGTGLRFITALAALRQGETIVDGVSHRPILPLVKALRDLGCSASCTGEGPPVKIEGGSLTGGRVVLQAAVSSQFTSALMQIAPHLPGGLQLRLTGPISSRPYIELTAALLRAFGVAVELTHREIRIQKVESLRSGRIEVEADASAAAFPLCAAAIQDGDVTVNGVGTRSLQGDRSIGEILKEMGCRVEVSERSIRVHGPPVRAISRSMEGTPDLVPAVAVVAAFARGESVISGVSHLRVKETDRLEVLCRGMTSLGIRAEVRGDLLRVVGSDGLDLRGADLDPAGDHRMAMAFALLALRVPGTRVIDPACVAKSDPGFFTRIEALIGQQETTR